MSTMKMIYIYIMQKKRITNSFSAIWQKSSDNKITFYFYYL